MAETPNADEVARIRARGREILDTLKTDPAFAAEVGKDPTTALVSRGIPEATALEWQKKPGGDVQGYDDDCYYTSTGSYTSCFDSYYY